LKSKKARLKYGVKQILFSFGVSMIIKFVMDTKTYINFMKMFSKVAEYISGMYTEPKYIGLKLLFTVIVPDFSVVMFAILSRLHFLSYVRF